MAEPVLRDAARHCPTCSMCNLLGDGFQLASAAELIAACLDSQRSTMENVRSRVPLGFRATVRAGQSQEIILRPRMPLRPRRLFVARSTAPWLHLTTVQTGDREFLLGPLDLELFRGVIEATPDPMDWKLPLLHSEQVLMMKIHNFSGAESDCVGAWLCDCL